MFPLTDLGTVAGVAVLVAVLMQVVKQWLPSEWSPAGALGLGIILALLGTVALDVVGRREIVQAIITGLLGGASAIGIYQVQKPVNVLTPK